MEKGAQKRHKMEEGEYFKERMKIKIHRKKSKENPPGRPATKD